MINIKLYCHQCGKFVGERTEMVTKLKKGTKCDVVCTCKECGNPKTDIPDFLQKLFGKDR